MNNRYIAILIAIVAIIAGVFYFAYLDKEEIPIMTPALEMIEEKATSTPETMPTATTTSTSTTPAASVKLNASTTLR